MRVGSMGSIMHDAHSNLRGHETKQSCTDIATTHECSVPGKEPVDHERDKERRRQGQITNITVAIDQKHQCTQLYHAVMIMMVLIIILIPPLLGVFPSFSITLRFKVG